MPSSERLFLTALPLGAMLPPLDCTFLRPIAHRGLHDPACGIIENTEKAFAAAIAGGYGVECDVRPAGGGLPVVFHDETAERLLNGQGSVAELGPKAIERLRYRDTGERLLTFTDALAFIGGRVPVLAEIKSGWEAPDPLFLDQLAEAARAYHGPLAFMSFDPAVLAPLRSLAPALPRGLVSGALDKNRDCVARIGVVRARALAHLLEWRTAAPSFLAYEARALPTPITRFVREGLGLPLFAWTVRSAAEWRTLKPFADAPIFEGFLPEPLRLLSFHDR